MDFQGKGKLIDLHKTKSPSPKDLGWFQSRPLHLKAVGHGVAQEMTGHLYSGLLGVKIPFAFECPAQRSGAPCTFPVALKRFHSTIPSDRKAVLTIGLRHRRLLHL